MEFIIKGVPHEVKRLRGLIAAASRAQDFEKADVYRREHTRLRATILIQEGQRMLAELKESE